MGVGSRWTIRVFVKVDARIDTCSGFLGATQQLWAAKAQAMIHTSVLTWLCPPRQGFEAVKSVPV